MHRVSKERIKQILELEHYPVIGDHLESLIRGYDGMRYDAFEQSMLMPEFMAKALGPPLKRLPSYATNYQKAQHPSYIATHGEHGIEGLGEVMEAMHSDMRRVAGRIARGFIPEITQHIPAENLMGDFKPGIVQGLMGINKAHMHLETPDPKRQTLLIHRNSILYNAFMLGAEARAHLTRPDDQKKALRESVGVYKQSYDSLCNMLTSIEIALGQSPEHEGTTLADYNLQPNIEKIAQAFYDRQKQFNSAYNCLYVASGGMLDPRLQYLKRALDGKRKPKKHIHINTSEDAASALLGLCMVIKDCRNEHSMATCQKLSESSPQVAAQILEDDYVMHDIADKLKASGLTDEGKTFVRDILDLLIDFKIKNLSKGASPHYRPPASGQAEGRH